jgi:two-component system, LytTR family, sensor kinase
LRNNFIKIRINSFWSYQIIGWLIFYFTDLILAFLTYSVPTETILVKTGKALVGFFATALLRLYYRRMKYHVVNFTVIIIKTLLASMIPAFLYYLSTALFWILLMPSDKTYSLLKTAVFISNFMNILPIFLGWSFLYFVIKFWLDWESEKEKAEKASSLAQYAQFQMLKYQLSPHFLFNSLNSVRALIDEDEKNAKEMITEISEFLRYSLLNNNKQDVLLKEELDAIKHYLSIEKKRYENKLEVLYDIDKSSEDCKVLSFIVHPLIENAIKFGMQSTNMPLKIKIKSSFLNNILKIEVINSGKLIDHSNSENIEALFSGAGLENVKARLSNAFSDNHKFSLFEEDGTVHAVLEISYNKE